MRVVFYIHELALNGAVTALLQQVRRMAARGDRISIMTPSLAGAAAALAPAFAAAGAELSDRLVVADHDVAVGCTVFAADMMRQVAGRMPTVWWIHEGRAGVNHILTHPGAHQTLMQVNKVIFPSRGVVEQLWPALLGSLPPARVDIVPYLIPPPPPGPAADRRPGHARVLCVGSIYPRKRQVDLIQAVTMLTGAPIECVLVGERIALSPPGDDLLAASPGRFTLTGGLQPEAVHAWYRASDVFALPSGDECMPISPVEATWHGVPVVLADLECYQGVWRHGVNALIHPVGDSELLAWYIRMLVESPNLRVRLSRAARAVALQCVAQRVGPLFDAALMEATAG